MTITIELLQANIQQTQKQAVNHRDLAEKHRMDECACVGAIQAYEQLLSHLVQAQWVANAGIGSIKADEMPKQPPVDNDHVAEGCEKFEEPVTSIAEILKKYDSPTAETIDAEPVNG